MFNVKESFEWMTPEFKIVDAGKDTIRIRGVAMRGNVISRNKRRYVADELKRAARTFIGKPITINHDPNKKAGNIVWMEYSDTSDALEYLGDVKKQPYVDMLRNKSTYVKGVSVEADYLHNQCPKCGKKFYTEEEFHNHMNLEHFIKTDPTHEPHGILGKALSLVLSPEEPGYPDTTIELMEFYRAKPILQLLETVITTHKEQKKMSDKKVKETKTKPKVPYKTKETLRIKEEDEKIEPGSHYCEEHPEDPRCKAHKKAIHDEEPAKEQTDASQAEGDTEPLACADGFHLETDDQGNQKCVADLPEPPVDQPTRAAEQVEAEPQPAIPEQPTQVKCPEGQHLDHETGLCIEDTTVVEPLPNVFETVELPTLIKLDEGCVWSAKGYSSGEACVSAMQGKVDDPEAYCYSKVGETVAETSMNIYDANKQIWNRLPLIEGASVFRDAKMGDRINKLNMAQAKQYKNFDALKIHTQKTTETLNRNFYSERKKTHKILVEVKDLLKTLDANNKKNMKATEEKLLKVVDGNQKFVTEKLRLEKGKNSLYAIAVDKAGNQSTASTQSYIWFDNEPPELTISQPEDDTKFYGEHEKSITIQGKTESGVSLFLNDRLIIVGSEGEFSTTYSLNEGNNQLKLVARDKAENETEKEITVSYFP